MPGIPLSPSASVARQALVLFFKGIDFEHQGREQADDSENTPGSGPQPEGGHTVTSPLLPELITEGDTIAEALINVEDAFAVALEIYADEGRPLPLGISMDDANGPVSVEAVVTVPIR